MLVRSRLALVLWLVSVAGVAWVSLQPRLELPIEFWNADKVYHLLAYAWLGLLPFAAFRRSGHALAAGLGMAVMGAGLEWAQGFIPGRFTSGLDMVANLLGVLSAMGTVKAFSRFKTDR